MTPSGCKPPAFGLAGSNPALPTRDDSGVLRRHWEKFERTYKRNHYNETPLCEGDLVIVWTTQGTFRGIVRAAARDFLHGDFRKAGDGPGGGLLDNDTLYLGIYSVMILRVERLVGRE